MIKSCTQVIVQDRNLDLQRVHGAAATVDGLVEGAIDLGAVEGEVIDEDITVEMGKRRLSTARLTAAISRAELMQSFLDPQ